MGRVFRVFEGRFGRLVLTDLAPKSGSGAELRAAEDPVIVLEPGEIAFLNPRETYTSREAKRALVFYAAREWLAKSFPAVFADDEKPFSEPRAHTTTRIRRLGETLAVEVQNDRFLSPERLEFMLQELVLSIVETYLAGRRASALWRGSRFEDLRVRQAIALLRAHPNKDLSMDELANQVGLSRSRFYDIFELCTGFSPRTYLDLLCVEAAIARLSSGQGTIAELSAELGFSAQSNFTRFFMNQVGVAPSEYRRAAFRPDTSPEPE